jgi:hypothetical protein
MNPPTSPSPAGPPEPVQASSTTIEERLARLFRHCAQAGCIHPLQRLIQLHLQGRKP